jgi:hypothetical protein
MNIKRFKEIDYEFRPKSYWDSLDDPLLAILKNVKRTRRRQMIRDYWKAGKIDEIAESLLQDSLSDEERERLGRIHPAFMDGEYLPDYEPGGVEIARVELESTTSDVISVRAARNGSRIVYSIVDEYDSEFDVSPASSEKPLNLGELIDLIDNAEGGESLALCYTMMNYSGDSVEDLDAIRFFTRVESVFYPQLSLHYKEVIDLWYEEEKRKIEATGAAE